jgi:hypothetical protein
MSSRQSSADRSTASTGGCRDRLRFAAGRRGASPQWLFAQCLDTLGDSEEKQAGPFMNQQLSDAGAAKSRS